MQSDDYTVPAAFLRVVRRVRFDPWVLLGLAAFLGLLFVALFGERIAPYEPIYFVVEHGSAPRPYEPGLVFPLGSDILGRDLLSLVLAGARATLTIVVLAGIARVTAGVLMAALGSLWRAPRMVTESLAELVSAVPATLVALILVLVFVKADRGVLVFIGALLVTGWAGPYRVVRAELDRLAHAPYTMGAVAVGVGQWRLFARHHLPHLVPVIAANLSQQIVASLVLVAELGVLGVFVGATRNINIEESLSIVRTGPRNFAQIAEPPEWGGLLANVRTIESIWTTRWLILVPAVAFAVTAVAVVAIGFALARRYARRDVFQDVRGAGGAAIVIAALGLFIVSAAVPERYAAAREWAGVMRSEVRPVDDTEAAFAAAGLRPVGSSFAVSRAMRAFAQTTAATVKVGDLTLTEPWPRPRGAIPADSPPISRSLLTAETGGGRVEAPLVYVGRGISPADFPPGRRSPGTSAADLGTLVQDYADDYARVDVRGRVVLIVRFLGVAGPRRDRFPNGYTFGPSQQEQINNAIKRGAAAVVLVDPALPYYRDGAPGFRMTVGEVIAGGDPYSPLERALPPTRATGVPVVVVDVRAARMLLTGTGVDLSEVDRFDDRIVEKYQTSPARALGVMARVEVPVEERAATVTSFIGETESADAESGRVLLWTERRPGADGGRDVLAVAAEVLAARRVPFVFVEFDPGVDAVASRQTIRELLKDRRITLVIVLDRLEGKALKFTTPYGDMIPALDLYAERAGARYEVTRTTPPIGSIEGVTPFPELRTVLVSGTGGAGDLRSDAAALVGYVAGRLALGAPEIPR